MALLTCLHRRKDSLAERCCVGRHLVCIAEKVHWQSAAVLAGIYTSSKEAETAADLFLSGEVSARRARRWEDALHSDAS